MKRSWAWIARTSSLVVVTFLFAGIAGAADVEWIGANNIGTLDFNAGAFWAAGFPGATDVAVFTGDNTNGNAILNGSVFTTQLTANASVENLRWEAGQFEITLDLAGFTLTNTGINALGRPLIQGTGASGVVLNITGTGTADWGEFQIGSDAGSTGTINLSGSGTELKVRNTGSGPTIGREGTGTLTISGGAKYTSARNTIVGSRVGASGTLTLSGSGTTGSVTSHIWIGDSGSASLTIEGGAQLQNSGASNYIIFGQGQYADDPTQTVTALITGSGSLLRSNVTNTARGIILGGNIDFTTDHRTAGTVHVTVADQGRMESSQMVVVYGRHTLKVDNGTVTAGTHLVAADESKFAFTLYNAARDALIQAGGDVTIGNNVEVTLSLGTGAAFSYGEFVELIQYAGSLGGTAGVFTNYAENDEFTLGAYDFRFTYAGGAGNDTIGLTVIPEPGSLALALLGLGGLAVRRRLLPGAAPGQQGGLHQGAGVIRG